jgi:hypothetical protein
LAFELFFCYTFIIETKGLSLEETAALFDGEEVVEQIQGRAHATATDEKEESVSDH